MWMIPTKINVAAQFCTNNSNMYSIDSPPRSLLNAADYVAEKNFIPNEHTIKSGAGSQGGVSVIGSGSSITHNSPNYHRKCKGSFVGTAQYVSPEVLNNLPITPAADLWALDCIIYQMIAGLPPFRGKIDDMILKEILANSLEFPVGFDTDAKDLVKNLLKLNAEDRLGAKDTGYNYISIRKHPFFYDIDFDSIRQCSPPAIRPYLPGVSQDDDNFSQNH